MSAYGGSKHGLKNLKDASTIARQRSRIAHWMFGVWGLGFGVWGEGFGVWDLGFGV